MDVDGWKLPTLLPTEENYYYLKLTITGRTRKVGSFQRVTFESNKFNLFLSPCQGSELVRSQTWGYASLRSAYPRLLTLTPSALAKILT